MTLPLAAELGHDYVTGMKEQLRSLYARGSLLLTLFASVVTSGAIVFWSDFFAIWTHGTIPDNPVLMMTLLIGTCVGAPSVLALSYANYSNRGYLLLWTKSLQTPDISFALVDPDSASRPDGCGDRGNIERHCGSIRNFVHLHDERNAAASDQARCNFNWGYGDGRARRRGHR